MKKRTIMLPLALFILIAILGTSYALWQLTLRQSGTNTVTTSCFKIEFKDQESINLENAYPLTDEDAKKLTPYEFTITNTCTSYAEFQVNLEILNDSTLNNLDFIRLLFSEDAKEKNLKFLNATDIVSPTLENASTSHKLATGYLNPMESKTFNL